jgi:hypothetical protein
MKKRHLRLAIALYGLFTERFREGVSRVFTIPRQRHLLDALGPLGRHSWRVKLVCTFYSILWTNN